MLLLGAAACGTALDDPSVYRLQVTGSDFHFEAPDTIPAGLVSVELDDLGPSPHHVVVLQVPRGRSAAEALDSIASMGSVPQWLTSIGGPEISEDPETRSRFISHLTPGDYVLACVLLDESGEAHYARGMVRGLVVASQAGNGEVAALSTSDTLLLHDFRYEFSPQLTAGSQRIWVENRGAKRHHAEILQLEPGTSFEAVINALSDPNAPQPLKSVGGFTGVSPGRSGWLEVELEEGSYVWVCFFFDVENQRPHFELSMLQPFEVTS